MSPWPLHGREAGKTNESSCNSAAPEFRPARQKGLQACSQMCSGTWHAKAIFNHGIYFFPSPSTILHLSICVWEGTAGPKSIPGVQGNPERLFRSRLEARKQNWPLGPAAECSYSVPLDSSCLPPKTPKEETCEWRCPAWRPLKWSQDRNLTLHFSPHFCNCVHLGGCQLPDPCCPYEHCKWNPMCCLWWIQSD